MYQSSVISWSSKIMYVATLARARATLGTSSRQALTSTASAVTSSRWLLLLLFFWVFQVSVSPYSLSQSVAKVLSASPGLGWKRLAGSGSSRQTCGANAAQYIAQNSPYDSKWLVASVLVNCASLRVVPWR